mmetsp:Transcript_39809/g.83685  ORF Transcript_39809/g.83685 Transcript_39809/m.83685 type:complete len:209 (-) Transcript_39809:829-1455(-)
MFLLQGRSRDQPHRGGVRLRRTGRHQDGVDRTENPQRGEQGHPRTGTVVPLLRVDRLRLHRVLQQRHPAREGHLPRRHQDVGRGAKPDVQLHVHRPRHAHAHGGQAEPRAGRDLQRTPGVGVHVRRFLVRRTRRHGTVREGRAVLRTNDPESGAGVGKRHRAGPSRIHHEEESAEARPHHRLDAVLHERVLASLPLLANGGKVFERGL